MHYVIYANNIHDNNNTKCGVGSMEVCCLKILYTCTCSNVILFGCRLKS